MPRRRTSNKPIRRRIKLDHKGDALTEMCRTFRAVKNGDLPRADGVRDVAMLDKIHSGMPEHTAGPSFTAPNINIYSVPSGFFLSDEQIQAIPRGDKVFDPDQCTPLPIVLDEPKDQGARLCLVEAPMPTTEAQQLDELSNLSLDELMRRAVALVDKA